MLARQALGPRLGGAMRARVMSDQASAIGRLVSAIASERTATIAFELAGPFGGASVESDGSVAECGTDFLMRQASSIGGGTTEMARNVVSESVLGTPRETSLDREVAFREVARGPSAHE